MWRTPTQKRWHLIEAMTGAGPMSIRGVARLAGRDVKAVHTDIQALVGAGILEKTGAGLVIFPCDAVRANFTIGKAA
jgi:predicted transcriptional regulator